jgi:hypothetical protein
LRGTLPAHTPYDGSGKLFQIGLKPLDLWDWIEIDGFLEDFLAEKGRLFALHGENVFVAEKGSEAGQREVLALLAEHLLRHFPPLYRREGDVLRVGATGRTVRLDDAAEPPLWTAAKLVPEDLVLMRKGPGGWRLAAASLSFPSSWTLSEKFGRPLGDIHAPVPGFGRGTRMAEVIDRIFDNLKPDQPAQRWNWSLQGDRTLYLPFSHAERVDRTEAAPTPRLPGPDPVAAAFIRVEKQTLRKLPDTGDILFTIRIHLDPMRWMREHKEGPQVARKFAEQLEALDEPQLAYKGFSADRERLVRALRGLAEAPAPLSRAPSVV